MAPSCASFLRLFLGVLLLTCCPPYLEDKGTPLAKPQRGDINKAWGTALGKPQRGDINKAWGTAPGKPQRGDINKARGNAPGNSYLQTNSTYSFHL